MQIAHLYKITNIQTNEYYIGKHNGQSQEYGIKKKSLYWGSGTRIRNQIRKYGTSNFKYDILVISDIQYIYELEKNMVTSNLIEEDNKCLNLKGGGYGSTYISKETKKKIGLGNLGKTRSEETKEKIRIMRAKQIMPKDMYKKTSKIMSTLTWMNDGVRSYRIKPENLQDVKDKGFTEGRLTDYINTEYKENSRKRALNQWKQIKAFDKTINRLIKVN